MIIDRYSCCGSTAGQLIASLQESIDALPTGTVTQVLVWDADIDKWAPVTGFTITYDGVISLYSDEP